MHTSLTAPKIICRLLKPQSGNTEIVQHIYAFSIVYFVCIYNVGSTSVKLNNKLYISRNGKRELKKYVIL
jgi:hypothetical protein